MNPFKRLFENKKRTKIRQDLIVSIDDRATGEPEVMTLRTTSLENITLMAKSDKISVHPDDLADAVQMLKTFKEARPTQPESLQPHGSRQLNELATQEVKAVEQTKEQEKKILDFSN